MVEQQRLIFSCFMLGNHVCYTVWPRGRPAAIGNTHSCLLLYYILAEEELFPLLLLAAEISVSVEINVHDNASIVMIVRIPLIWSLRTS